MPSVGRYICSTSASLAAAAVRSAHAASTSSSPLCSSSGGFRGISVKAGTPTGDVDANRSKPKLLLTSSGFLNVPALEQELSTLLQATQGTKNCWYIPTAALRAPGPKGASPEERKAERRAFVESQQAGIRNRFGLNVVELDPESVQSEAELGRVLVETFGEESVEGASGKKLPKMDLVYVEAGNTYALIHHLKRTGAADLIRNMVESGRTVYSSASAGSICAGKTVQMALWKDWDDKTAQGTLEVDWTDKDTASGLDLLGDTSFLPHADGVYGEESWQLEQRHRLKHDDHDIVAMPDGTGYAVCGTERWFVEPASDTGSSETSSENVVGGVKVLPKPPRPSEGGA